MPVIRTSQIEPPKWHFNGHIQTIFPNLTRKIEDVQFERQRLELQDGDFIDLDWSTIGSDSLVIISHGLEGNSRREYVKGLVKIAAYEGMDALAWNYRGCSGEPNRKLSSYHSGKTEDLHELLEHVQETRDYDRIFLVGISLGGNITMKYLGEEQYVKPANISGAVAVSVPCHLSSALPVMVSGWNRLYNRRFVRQFKEKLKAKMERFRDAVDYAYIFAAENMIEFAERFTVPVNGFKDLDEYYEVCSSSNYIHRIEVPTLLINALNDPLLSPECFPYREADKSPYFFLETPRYGGHVGFIHRDYESFTWMEKRVMEFIQTHL